MKISLSLRRPLAFVSLCLILGAANAYADLPSVPPDQDLSSQTLSDMASPVVVRGDIALLGSPGTAGQPDSTGYVEVWRRLPSGNCVGQPCWTLTGRLPEPPGLQPGNYFGTSIGFDGTTALIGSPSSRGGQEAVYVYALQTQGWMLKQTLRSGAAEPTNFGRALALDGNTAAIVAHGFATPQSAIAFYERGSDRVWRRKARFVGPENGNFSLNVALDRGTAIVGSAWSTENGLFSNVLVFERRAGRWSAAGAIDPASGPVTTSQGFGSTVAIRGDLAVVTDPFFDPQGDPPANHSGAAYVFRRGLHGWQQIDRFTPHNDATWTMFGLSAVIHGRFVGIGASTQSASAGALYVFEPVEGHYADVLKFSHPTSPKDFPGAASFDGRTLMISGFENVRWVWNVADHVQ